MARSLQVPEAGQTLVRVANFSDKALTLRSPKQESTERENRRAKIIQPSSDGLSDEQKRQFSLLIDQYEGIFAINNSDLG